MYVLRGEPTIWLWEGGRAGVAMRDLISGEPTRGEVGRYMVRRCVLPREALLLWHVLAGAMDLGDFWAEKAPDF